jgi:hypothetical protein
MRLLKAGFICILTVTLGGCAEWASIRSYPPGAKAYIDGQYVGTTPTGIQIPRSKVTAPHTWRVEFRNCEPAEGTLGYRVAPGRIVGYIFTVGILAIFRGPYYYPVVNAALTGGDCETASIVKPAPVAGITINQIVGDRNQTGGESQATKTQKLAERLTTLRDLYNRKLISQEVYDRESQNALEEFKE